MAVYLAAIHMSGGSSHEHIANFIWMNELTYKSGASTVAGMVSFIEGGGTVMVSNGVEKVHVGVVRSEGKEPYLRSFADKAWTDNILELPKY
jgi:hypothetical protein